MDFTALLDAPDALAKPIQIATLGKYTDSRYGDFAITKKDVKDWQKNLSRLPGGEALIDFEHRSEKAPRDSRAAGWISGIHLEGDKVMATPRWTPDGEQAIKNGTYRFISVAYGNHRDEHGNEYPNTLMSAGLTNKPALVGLPAVVLASEERVSEAASEEIVRLLDLADPDTRLRLDAAQRATLVRLMREDDTPEPADSRQHEMPSEALTTLLDLPADTDEQTLLEAVQGLKAKAAKRAKKQDEKPVKTLEQAAADEGKIVLDQADWEKTQRQAKAGAAAMKQLHQRAFDTAFDTAVRERKATPGEKDTLTELYKAAPDATLKMLEARQPVLPEKPLGAPSIQFDPDAPENFDPQAAADAGVSPDSVQLDAAIQKHLREKGLPASAYHKVLDQYLNEGLML